MAGLSDILETTSFEKLASGYVFTEGPEGEKAVCCPPSKSNLPS